MHLRSSVKNSAGDNDPPNIRCAADIPNFGQKITRNAFINEAWSEGVSGKHRLISTILVENIVRNAIYEQGAEGRREMGGGGGKRWPISAIFVEKNQA